jgi:Flp pilus assembly protein TadD
MYYLARQIREECPVCCANLGESLITRGRYEKAIWCFKEACRLNPRMPRVHARLAAAFTAMGQPEQATRLYIRDLREDPGNIRTLIELGAHLESLGRLPEAAEKFRRILELEPANAQAHFHLGQIAMRSHDYESAAIEFELVSRLDDQHPGLRWNMAIVMFHTGRMAQAREHLASVMESLSAQEPDLRRLAELLFEARMLNEAEIALGYLTQQSPDDANAWHRLGTVRLRRGKTSAGIACARRALRIEPHHIGALHNLLLAYLREGRLGRAQVILRKATHVAPDDPSIRRLGARFRTLCLVHTLGRMMRRTTVRLIGLGHADDDHAIDRASP